MSRIGPEAAGDVLREGGVVLLDTDTLPGLHGLATVAGVAARIAALKGHPPERPYLLLVPSLEAALDLGEPAAGADRELLAKLWPGELTALLKPREGLPAAGQGPARTLDEAIGRFPDLPSLDLGITPRQGASTIVDFSVVPPRLIRPGIVPFGD